MTLVAVEASRPWKDPVGVPMPAHLQGPHGRFEAIIGLESTDMRGPGGWDGRLAWGSVQGRAARRQLRNGVEIRVGSETGIVRQPRQDFTRWGRSVHVELGGVAWRWRHRRLGTLRFERSDGTAVAESNAGLRTRELVEDTASPLEVALAVLTWFAGLDVHSRGLAWTL